jgi:predicted TIM-barrel fold metal-dependent hydrolase
VSAPPPLLRRAASDEYAPLPWSDRDRRALARLAHDLPLRAHGVGMTTGEYRFDRRGTASTLQAIDAEHGGGFFDVPEAAAFDLAAADAAFGGGAAVVDVQTHLVDPARWSGSHAAALAGFLAMVDPVRWPSGVDPYAIDAGAWAGLVFGASETAVALLTSTPGPADSNVLTNPQIAAAREVVDRYADSGRVLTHAIVHPNVGEAELDAMADWSENCRPSGWKCYTLWGPPTKASPTGGWFLDDEEVGFPFLERVRALGPRVVAAHKGLGGPVPGASLAAASPRDIGPAAAAFPDIDFVVYHSGYERDPDGQEGPYDVGNANASASTSARGVDRLIATLAAHSIGPGMNVYAELGTTWFLMLRRPLEAAHVLGKLLVALGPEGILWGTDSVWYGSPQPLIDAFRAFRIPEAMQERYGYPPLDSDTKERILSVNARRVYGISDATLDRVASERDRSWVANAAPALQRALSAAS